VATDSPLEEMEHREHVEHALEALESGDKLVSRVTLTIAVLAVLAAIAASLETTESDASIVAKNDAVLAQNRASDTWNQFQAESLKRHLYTLAADEGGAKGAVYAKEAAKRAQEAQGLTPKAKVFEAQRDAALEQSDRHELRHGRLTVASTLLHMAIAIATLAILLRRSWPWITSLALSAAGLAAAAWAYL